MKEYIMMVINFFDEYQKSPWMVLFVIGGIAAFAYLAIKFTKKKKPKRHDIKETKKQQFSKKPVEKGNIPSRGMKED